MRDNKKNRRRWTHLASFNFYRVLGLAGSFNRAKRQAPHLDRIAELHSLKRPCAILLSPIAEAFQRLGKQLQYCTGFRGAGGSGDGQPALGVQSLPRDTRASYRRVVSSSAAAALAAWFISALACSSSPPPLPCCWTRCSPRLSRWR